VAEVRKEIKLLSTGFTLTNVSSNWLEQARGDNSC